MNKIKRFSTNSGGFIKAIILVVIGLVILKSAFGVTISEIFDNKIVQDIWAIIKGILKVVWQAIVLVLDFLKLAITKSSEFLSGLKN